MTSIIIATYMRYQALGDCVAQLLSMGEYSASDELIIVDNSPQRDQACINQIEAQCEGKIAFQYLNFSGRFRNDLSSLRNRGILKSTGDTTVFLDDDSFILTPNWTRIVGEILDKDANVAGVTGNLIEPQKDIVDWDGRSPIGKITDKGDVIGHFFKRPGRDIGVDHMRGCFMAFRRSALSKTGGFDEKIKGLYIEETELCHRLSKAGFKLILTPRITVDHRMANRDGLVPRLEMSNRTIYHKAKNTFYFFLRHYISSPKVFFHYLYGFYRPRLGGLLKRGEISVLPSFVMFPAAFFMAVILFISGPKMPLCQK